MHSSRMSTARLLPVSPRSVPGPGVGGVPGPSGVYLVPGGVSGPEGGVPGPWGGGTCPGPPPRDQNDRQV